VVSADVALMAKAPNDAVPATLNGYDLTGARIWFQFHAEANGPMPEILYFNGRRVAMGDDLEPVVLFDQAKPGDKVTVAVKLLHTVDTKTFRGATLRIDFPERAGRILKTCAGVSVGGAAGAFACAGRCAR
jgi:alpha-mannosidase